MCVQLFDIQGAPLAGEDPRILLQCRPVITESPFSGRKGCVYLARLGRAFKQSPY